jgi:hypothetical protein
MMSRSPKYFLATLVILIGFFSMIPYTSAKDWTFRGKVIDFDTKQPIEGAVVVASWDEETPTLAGPSTRYKDVKETLTDKNGEWSMVGPKGKSYDPYPYVSLILGIYYTKHPDFIIFKPGYESHDRMKWSLQSFDASPYVNKKKGLEGIVLWIKEKEKEYSQKMRKEFPTGFPYGTPFIPMKDPETKLKNLDIPFDYPEDVKRIFTEKSFQFADYTVIGLRKLKTKEERLMILPGLVGGEGSSEKQKEFIRLINEESKNLGLDEYKRF